MTENCMENPDGFVWAPVEIQPLTPMTSIALLHHRHNSGVACSACEIVRLRKELTSQVAALEAGKQPHA